MIIWLLPICKFLWICIYRIETAINSITDNLFFLLRAHQIIKISIWISISSKSCFHSSWWASWIWRRWFSLKLIWSLNLPLIFIIKVPEFVLINRLESGFVVVSYVNVWNNMNIPFRYPFPGKFDLIERTRMIFVLL